MVELQVQFLRTAARLTGNPVFRQMAFAAMPGLRALRRASPRTPRSRRRSPRARPRRRPGTDRSRPTVGSRSEPCASPTPRP
jgi:hypothetical protein